MSQFVTGGVRNFGR